MVHLIGNFCTDIVTTSNLPLNKISRHQGGLIVNHQVVEEPDAGKLACPVLVRRESRAFSATGAFDWEAVFPRGAFLPVPT